MSDPVTQFNLTGVFENTVQIYAEGDKVVVDLNGINTDHAIYLTEAQVFALTRALDGARNEWMWMAAPSEQPR